MSQCQAQPGSTPWGCGAGLGARGTLLPLWFGQGEGEAARGLLHTSATACVLVVPLPDVVQQAGRRRRKGRMGWDRQRNGYEAAQGLVPFSIGSQVTSHFCCPRAVSEVISSLAVLTAMSDLRSSVCLAY